MTDDTRDSYALWGNPARRNRVVRAAELWCSADQRDLDSFDAALESASYLDVPGGPEWVWPLTDWPRADYARLRYTPSPCLLWWR